MSKKTLKWIFIDVGIFLIIYALIACLPFAGRNKVMNFSDQDFNIEHFYGEGESGERIMLLDEPIMAFKHRINIINHAKEELFFSTYALHEGKSFDIFMGAIINAANRGVKVKLLLDGKFASIDQKLVDILLSFGNVEIYLYNRFNIFKPQNINVCLHDKYLVIDNQYLIFGGRNIGDKYFFPDDYEGNFSYDREVLVYNAMDYPKSIISSVKEYFFQTVSTKFSSIVKDQKKSLSEKAQIEQKRILDVYQDYQKEIDDLNYRLITMPVNKISLITNPLNELKKTPTIAYNLLMLAKNSQKVIAQSPYTILTNHSMNYLKEVCQEVDEFILLTNSLASTPNLPGYSNYYVNRQKYLNMNIKIFEYQSQNTSIHSKTFLFDERLTVIGSFNLDERSIRIDTESMLVIDSLDFNQYTKDVINTYLNQSLEVGTNNQYVNDINNIEIPVSFFKKGLYAIVGFVLNICRYLL